MPVHSTEADIDDKVNSKVKENLLGICRLIAVIENYRYIH